MHNHNSSVGVRAILIVLLVIGGVYLFFDHGQHLLPYLPFTFLLGCLAMHLFMHSGHGGHGGDTSRNHNEHDQSKP